MDRKTQTHFDNIHSEDRQVQNEAFTYLLKVTEKPVDWAYDVWDELLADLQHKDNHVRAIAAQVLCNLAKSDPQSRMLKDLDKLVAVTKDERFVTARHCMQALWKIGVLGQKQQKLYLEKLTARFRECAAEKNCTLIRFDIQQSLRTVYDMTKNEDIREQALALIETEPDLKYGKKYATVWRHK
jgi:hypothetical protein